jgi:3',5'-nucleoside bisphosphate phosphatase
VGIRPNDLVDLHTHSTASDGTLRPFELILAAQRTGVRMVALTDHDTLDGLDGLLAAAGRYRVHAVPGIEISSRLGERQLHILGLGLRRHLWPGLEQFLEQTRSWRAERNEKILDRLNELGFPLTWENVRAECGGEIVARPHFARALTTAGHVGSLKHAFVELLGDGCPAHVPKRRPQPSEVVQVLQAAGGVAIVAHPNSLVAGDGGPLIPVLEELLGAGIDGIEAFHPKMSPALTQEAISFAGQHGLLVTGGSDFHGRNKPDNPIGRGHGGRKLFARPMVEAVTRFEEIVRW